KITASGRDCTRTFYNRLSNIQIKVKRGDCTDYKNGLNQCYEEFYSANGHELGHYFRFIYRILKFIDESGIENKNEYSGVLRSQFSNAELALLFYNGLSDRGLKFKPLSEKFSLFENIELESLLNYQKDCA